jgi:hypothetical protein
VSASVQEIGIEIASAIPPAGRSGNFLNLDLTFGFKPPSGLGIAIEAGPVHGGGFVSFEPDAGRYFGVLQLQIFAVAVNAVALLETRLPGGTPPFSFMLLITAEFPPLQLGMGFTLNGLGGLAGLHRSLAADPLRAALREGSVSQLLFPTNPVANAPRILQALQRFVPATADRYLFGPVVKIGYGTPTLIEAQLGLMLELPAPLRIILLGALRAAFPNREAPVVRINLDVLGVLDLGASTLSLDASLYDSRVAAFEISGDMAFRLTWGAAPVFALSVGGFNPHFQPPAGFPALRRLTLALGSGDNPRLAVEAYFALTSNTLQFGARATLHAEAVGFSIDGELSFDALVIFDPFGFRIDVAAALALRGFGLMLAIRVQATIEGPQPWHITGRVHITVLLIDADVPFEVRFGPEERPAPTPLIDDLWPRLSQAVGDVHNWTGELTQASPGAISYAAAAGAGLLLDPVGALSVRQQLIPLARRIVKIGERRLPEARTVVLNEVRVEGAAVAFSPVDAPFASAQYEDLTEAEKLSRPSFEPMQAGARATSATVTCGTGTSGELSYKTIRLPSRTADAALYQLPAAVQTGALRFAMSGVPGLRGAGLAQYAPAASSIADVQLSGEQYAVVSSANLARTGIAATGPHGAAAAELNVYLDENPSAAGTVLVVPLHELEAAA